MKITFSFDYSLMSDPREWRRYEAAKDAKLTDSVRQLALQVIHEAHEVDNDFWLPETDEEIPIQIYVADEKISSTISGFNELGFGIPYAIDTDGGIVMLEGYEPLGHDWTVAEIKELIDEGYIEGSPHRLIIGTPTGLGAAPTDVFDLLQFLSALLQLATFSPVAYKYIAAQITDKDVRKIAEQWTSNGIRYPKQLRLFIEKKAEWKMADVKRRLKLNEEQATLLLSALGYEIKGNTWRLTHSAQSIESLRKWKRNETRHSQINQIS